MRFKILAIWLTAILAISPLIGSGEYAYNNYPESQENPVYVHADGFTIAINTENPGVEFYHLNETVPVFSVYYRYIYAYSDDMASPEYVADLSKPLWTSSFYNTTEEDGTVRTVVRMSAPLDMRSDTSFVQNWGKIDFEFLILVRGDEAQLGISLKMSDLKPLSGVSHIALAQKLGASDEIKLSDGRISISGVYYRWDHTASIKENGREKSAEVDYTYSGDTLYLAYPYNRDVQEISHYSGRINLRGYAVIKDITSDVLGYGIGILLGSILLGIPYVSHRKRKKSPFDMNSPLYRK